MEREREYCIYFDLREAVILTKMRWKMMNSMDSVENGNKYEGSEEQDHGVRLIKCSTFDNALKNCIIYKHL